MPWYAIAIIVWFIISSGIQVVMIDRSVTISRGGALLTIVLNTLMIWGIISLAGH